MDKYKRNDEGYKYDYPDGIYEVVHINDLEQPIEKVHKYSRIVEIKNGMVVFDDTDIKISQLCFFEVNEVVDFLPSF
jgi:hypothetical protein